MNIQQTYRIPTIMTWLMFFKIEMECGVYNFIYWFVLIFRTFCVFHINDKNVDIAESTCTNQCEVKMNDLETRKTYMLQQAVFYIGRTYKKSQMCPDYEWLYSSTKRISDMHINCSSWDKSTTLKYSYIRNVDYKLEF